MEKSGQNWRKKRGHPGDALKSLSQFPKQAFFRFFRKSLFQKYLCQPSLGIKEN
jgi:hypothetical protein